MTAGQRLLVAICVGKRYDVFAKIVRDKLIGVEETGLFKLILDYYRITSDLPPISKLKETFTLEEATGDADYYLKEVNDRHIYTYLGENIPRLIKGLKTDPHGTLDQLTKAVSTLNSDETTTDEFYSDNWENRLAEYEAKKGTKGITYLSTGDDYLDSLTFGYRKSDLWTIGGRAGTKKTFTLIHLASICESVLPETMGDILFVSNEMALDQIRERFDAVRSRVSYKRLQMGELEPGELSRYKMKMAMMKSKKSRIILSFNVSTLDELSLKVSMYRPSIIFLDGSYLLYPKQEDGLGKNLMITRGMKKLANDTGLPLINTTQLRKKTGKKLLKDPLSGQDEFYYGGYVQDSDFAIRTFVSPSMVYDGKIGWDFVKSRRVERNVAELLADLDKMNFKFMEKSSDTAESEIVEF